MRLKSDQIQLILQTIHRLAGDDTSVYLFGSRLNDNMKGGDVDLYIESDARLSLLDRARIKASLESQLGLPVDIVSKARSEPPTPFQQIAQSQAYRLPV